MGIASGNIVGLRRCGDCRRERQEADFDRNAQGRLQLTCRLCLVSYSILPLLSTSLEFGN